MNEEHLEAIEGIVDTIIFQNEENGYTICGLVTADDAKEILVGVMPFVVEGDTLTAYGTWIVNAKYGKQFRVTSYEKRLPTREADILQYLSAGAVKGIGPKLAVKIVGRFGEETFDVIENHPSYLAEIPGISQKSAEAISKRFIESAGARQVMMYCKDFFTPGMALKIYQTWGTDSVRKIQLNPYQLCDQFYSISFKAADRLAASNGVPRNDLNRIRAGILAVLGEQAQRFGHTCLPETKLVELSMAMLGDEVSELLIFTSMQDLLAMERLFCVSIDGKSMYFRSEYYQAETYIADKLKRLDRQCPAVSMQDVRQLTLEAENQAGLTYAREQRTALMTAMTNGVMILTGGPGTGKTTIIKGLVTIFEALDLTVTLAAPTGRAAKRMSEATSQEAKTIHRLLEMEVTELSEPKFYRCEKNPLDSQVLIIDEASMIDVVLMESLLRAVRPGSRVILIGDVHQLPSVSAGNLLGDLIASELFPVVRLTEIFRQSEDSRIVLNSHLIQEGKIPDLSVKSNDFFFLNRATPEEVAQTVVDLVKTRLPKTYGPEVIEQIQVITPSHKGEAGTYQLNMQLQNAMNPGTEEKQEKFLRIRSLREGDKIMQIRNNYTLTWKSDREEGAGVFNGDIGRIEKVDHDMERLVIRFDDREVLYDFAYLDELEHAYAITVHKSQGSEYPIVILPIFDCASMLLTRNLLYTAITRASKMVILVGRQDLFARMIANDRHDWRSTGLPYFLKKL